MGRWVRRHAANGTRASLAEFGAHSGDDALAAEIERLDAWGFSAEQSADWEGKSLWKALEAWRRQARRRPANGHGEDYGLYRAAG